MKLEVGASSGIRSYSIVLEAENVKFCMVNFENVQNGDNDLRRRLELVQCINQNVSTMSCSTEK